jgi:pyruvate-ferredoxin/flavodoxin oxidoreductase
MATHLQPTEARTSARPRYPGIRLVCNGNQLVALHTEARIADAGIFYPITPSTEMGEMFQLTFSEGSLNVFGRPKLAVETEGEHAAQGGAIAYAVTGKRVVNFTSGQGVVYGIEQYYHAPGKLATMVVEVAARALTKHALNVHCGHDDIYAALDTGWIMLMARDAQQAADQALILRRVTELALTPGMNIQDGFLTSHLERTFFRPEAGLLREFLGAPDDVIDCPTPAQRELFGPRRRRIPEMIDLTHPILLGPVQNQEHYMNGVVARRNCFYEPIMGFLEDAYREFGELTGRHYGVLREKKTEEAETVFVSLGSAAENIEAAVDYLEDTRGEKVGSIHVNVLRPFPEEAIARALKGKKTAIILERTDEALAGDNPLARDVRTALSRALETHKIGGVPGRTSISEEEMPRLFSGTYGLGSRDFRPEGIIGAYEFARNLRARRDGRRAFDGETYFTLGIDHPYEVLSDDRPSLLPDHAIAVRLHSIGGWGMITTGKNLSAIIGTLGEHVAQRRGELDKFGQIRQALHVSANPRYGSEKKGAPTAYFLVVAPERIRVNCDLRHVDVVLCCDPKAFTHSDPLAGIAEGGGFVWECDESPEMAWRRIPKRLRKRIIDRKIRLFILPGFEIARAATDRPDLQLRMQGNAFLGAFFGVSSFLEDNDIERDHFLQLVRDQYEKKFGRFGEAVVESNMTVMRDGMSRVREVPWGDLDAPDDSAMRGERLLPCGAGEDGGCGAGNGDGDGRPNVFRSAYFDAEFRAGLGYRQPASPLASVGVMAAATGATASKYVARRETPVFIAENCTQCMACISACPDTALPNTAQELSTVLTTAIENYVTDESERAALLEAVPGLDEAAREAMNEAVAAKEVVPLVEILSDLVQELPAVGAKAKEELTTILQILPLAYGKVNAIYRVPERKEAGAGGIFSIFVSDLCKGCGECVTECGEHMALRMEPDSEDLNARVASATAYLDLLPDTSQQYLGLYDDEAPQDSRAATLRNHLMVRRNYQALTSGDGACAGCGEKSILHVIASLTEAYMRPMYHRHAERLDTKARSLERDGIARLESLQARDPAQFDLLKQTIAHAIMGLGGENDEDTRARMGDADLGPRALVGALTAVMRQEARNRRDLETIDGRLANGMSVMAMGASTGCNTVYGSTPPNNPHPYPWMNSLFQDGSTISWMLGESFVDDHGRRAVIPERLCDAILTREDDVVTPEAYFDYTHFSDALMTDREIAELPKVWCVGGDGGLGDIGFQNLSKVVLQNRPNVNIVMLDTQVYSNTGGQNSDSTPMPGGGDMNQIGAATQGKMNEKKSVAEILTAGHGSPFVAQVSMADEPRLLKAVLDGLAYRGTSFFQCFTTCQPEHGVGDHMSTVQAHRIRDSRGMPQFVFDPAKGETYPEAFDLSGNPLPDRDWKGGKARGARRTPWYTVAHWAATEARFRRHLKKITQEQTEVLVPLDHLLLCVTQDDVRQRRFLDPAHRAFVPDFGAWIELEGPGGKPQVMAVSRQLVLFCVERRKAWRLLQSKAGVSSLDYPAHRALLAKLEAGTLTREDVLARGRELLEAEEDALKA